MVRSFGEEYFIANPEQFATEHLPLHDGHVISDLQFNSHPFSSIDEWNNCLHVGPMVPSLGVTILTKDSVLVTKENTVDVKLRCPRGLRLWHKLKCQNTDKELDHHVMQLWEEGVVTFRLHLPGKGKYKTTIYGAAETIKQNHDNGKCNIYGIISTYSIVASGELVHSPLPKDGVYGVLPQAIAAGYYCISHTRPVIETYSNKLTFEFARPVDGSIIPNLFHEERPNLKIIDSIYREPFPKKTALHLALSKPGRYCLEVFAQYGPKSNSGVHTFAARFLIICLSEKKASFFADPNTWGPNEEFGQRGITCLDVAGSTIHAPHGKGCITFTSPIAGGREMTYNLLAPGLRGTWKEIPNYQTWIFGEVIARKHGLRYTRFNFRIPECGFYQFLLGYGEKFMGRWLVACPEANIGDLFPIRQGLWGPSRKMSEELGMKFSHPVRFNAVDGEVDISVEIPPHLPHWHVFAHLRDVEGPRLILQSKDISRASDSSKKGWRAINFHLMLPDGVKTAILTLSIGQQKSKNSKVIRTTNEGCWLVSRI